MEILCCPAIDWVRNRPPPPLMVWSPTLVSSVLRIKIASFYRKNRDDVTECVRVLPNYGYCIAVLD